MNTSTDAPNKSGAGAYEALAVIDPEASGTRTQLAALRRFGFSLTYAQSLTELASGLQARPDVVYVSDVATRPAGDLLQLVRERGYEGPVIYCTFPRVTWVGWYYGADCTLCQWDPYQLACLMKDMIGAYREGRLRRHSLDRRPTIFLSHSAKDHSFVERLAKALLAHGFFVWYDEWELRIGDSITEKIQDGLGAATFLAVILSPDSIGSNWVKQEVGSAMIDQIAKQELRILPILYRACEVPALLKAHVYADFTGDFDEAFADFLKRFPRSIPAPRKP